jgi:NitT/TauT family transport system ATP-binding protein
VGAARRRQADPVREGGGDGVREEGPSEVQVLSARRPRIVVRDLTKTFRAGAREVAAVDRASFEVLEGEFVAIVGPSGCGKSTILNMIGGLVTPSAGAVLVDGVPVTGAPTARAALARIGYVFQKDTVFPWRTVARNIALGLEYRGVPRHEVARRVSEAVSLAGLEGFEEAFPATLSGGMRQRVALMRTLVVDPEILLMDEPFGALDTHTKLTLHAELLALWQARRQTVVFVTHDLSEAITLADRIVVMTRRPGRVKMVHEVKLERPRDVIALRERDEYAREYGRVWHVLGEEFAG